MPKEKTNMKKELFKKSSMQEIKKNATIGNKSVDAKYAYINGYYEAGNHLIKVAINMTNTTDKDSLVYPICFNYRHYIELHLKSLIEEGEVLYEKMEQLGYLHNGKLSEKVSDSLDSTHSLCDLLALLKKILFFIAISNEEFPKDIEKYIKQMHDTDTNGQKYRYHKNKSGKLHFPNEESYDIDNMSKIMKEVNRMLWAIDSHIFHYIEMSNDIISEYESAMEHQNY